MKPLPLTALAALLFAVSPSLRAQQSAPPLVTTTGTAEMKIVPDLADLSFEVEVRNRELAPARKAQAERANKVVAALRALGVAGEDLHTSQALVDPDFLRRDGSEGISVRYYRVHQTIACTLHDLAKVPDATTDAIAAGATDVGSVDLRAADLARRCDEVRAKAVANAKDKALQMATGLGAKLGKPYTINDFDNGDRYSSIPGLPEAASASAGAASAGPPSVFVAGKLTLSASVRVAFILE